MRPLRLAVPLAALAAPLAAQSSGAGQEMQRARDGNIAIQEELDAARKAGTVAAYDLFIARHPDHPLARTAREERQRLVDAHEGQAGRKP